MANSPDVVIVGLGAMGSAAAYHLARRGCKVVGLDRFTPPHAFGSSHGKTRIIREAYFEHPHYVPLVQRSYELWNALERSSGRDLLTVTGGLMIGRPDGVLVTGARRSAEAHSLPYAMLTAAEVSARFPALRPADDMVAVLEPRAGILFPEACVDAHLTLAREHGATLRFDEAVTGWRRDGDGVRVVSANGEFRAAQLLLTAGSWITSLVPELKLPFTVERQVIYWFAPRAHPENFAAGRCPIHLWETAPQEFIYGFPDLGDGVKLAVHHAGDTTGPDQVQRNVGDGELASMRERVRRFVPDADGELRAATVCLYTNTPDEHFWIDRHPQHGNVLIASPCSGHGFKFAPVIGEALADLLIDGRSRFDLSLFRRR